MKDKSKFCCLCGRPRGVATQRTSWDLKVPLTYVPQTENPDEHGCQILNDFIVHVAAWRNGGSDSSTHICDECVRVVVREIKIRVDEQLVELDVDHDKDVELAHLNRRVALLQHELYNQCFNHNRMQDRLGEVLKILAANGVPENQVIEHAKWEVSRGHVKARAL